MSSVTKLDRLSRSIRGCSNCSITSTKGSVSLGHSASAVRYHQLAGPPAGACSQPQEFERELIRERTSAGRNQAKANGVRFGRKPKLTPHQRAEALQRRRAGETLLPALTRV
jgi:DNA invertase Pin-like site-specific DNA recombinase